MAMIKIKVLVVFSTEQTSKSNRMLFHTIRCFVISSLFVLFDSFVVIVCVSLIFRLVKVRKYVVK